MNLRPYFSNLLKRRRVILAGLFCLVTIPSFIFYYGLLEEEETDSIQIAPIAFSDYELDPRQSESSSSANSDSDPDQACRIPKLEPFADIVSDYFSKSGAGAQSCEKEFPLLFQSTLDAKIIPAKEIGVFQGEGIAHCCYKVISRKDQDDSEDGIEMSKECFPLSLQSPTEIPPEHEFMSIYCAKATGNGTLEIVDMAAFVHMKHDVKQRVGKVNNRQVDDKSNKPNVIIFGMDGSSRMNFLRSMPQSHKYLEALGALEFTGYNKVSDNTFPNMMPMLTSWSATQVDYSCGFWKIYDSCPFIWKRFAEQGYATCYAEDESDIGMFNFRKRGFLNPPTDYYFRPFGLAATRDIATQQLVSARLCYGPRIGFQVMVDYMKKLVHRMSSAIQPFFHFSWSNSLTHDNLSWQNLGDVHLLEGLQWLNQSGTLNSTVLILMSDHGLRVGGFRNTIQGQFEDRLPFLFILLPEWIKTEYSAAYRNLVGNIKRLITTYDLHQLLLDILELDGIENDSVERREFQLTNEEEDGNLPRGISPFLPIPKSRTCEMAGIEGNFCSCKYLKQIRPDSLPARQAAQLALSEINYILRNFKSCALLELSEIKMAQRAGLVNGYGEGYQVNFETSPGNATFEAFVMKQKSRQWFRKGTWVVSGSIGRTNFYKNQSNCVNDTYVKMYCYCL